MFECKTLLESRAIEQAVRWGTCPFDSAYLTRRPVEILGIPLPAGQEFHLDMDEHKDDLQLGTPRFRRMSGFQEEHEGGHD